jgi:hypothetical protein
MHAQLLENYSAAYWKDHPAAMDITQSTGKTNENHLAPLAKDSSARSTRRKSIRRSSLQGRAEQAANASGAGDYDTKKETKRKRTDAHDEKEAEEDDDSDSSTPTSPSAEARTSHNKKERHEEDDDSETSTPTMPEVVKNSSASARTSHDNATTSHNKRKFKTKSRAETEHSSEESNEPTMEAEELRMAHLACRVYDPDFYNAHPDMKPLLYCILNTTHNVPRLKAPAKNTWSEWSADLTRMCISEFNEYRTKDATSSLDDEKGKPPPSLPFLCPIVV